MAIFTATHTVCLSMQIVHAGQTGSNGLLSLFMVRLFSREYQARHLDIHFILIILFSLLLNIEIETKIRLTAKPKYHL